MKQYEHSPETPQIQRKKQHQFSFPRKKKKSIPPRNVGYPTTVLPPKQSPSKESPDKPPYPKDTENENEQQ